MPEILIERNGAVGRVVVSNPAKFNAMTTQMWAELPARIAELDADPAIRVIVLAGEGDRAFVSGADISQFDDERSSAAAQERYKVLVDKAYLAPTQASKPVIAEIRGYCMGGGLGLALGCDLRICSDDARFRMPAARLGLGYDERGLRRFAAQIGAQNTFDIFYTARTFNALDALRMNYVSRVVPAAELAAEVQALAGTIAANAPLTLKAVKLSVGAYLRDACEVTTHAAQVAIEDCGHSSDYKEGVLAFAEKRAPRFIAS